ncbi:MAG: penicillin-binding transpeptidase domain-containing protein, partial [Myxococcota bacterium]
TGMLPLTGIVAPFLSAGRTSTAVFVVLVGLIAKLGEHGELRAETDTLAELRRGIVGAGGVLALAGLVAVGVLFGEAVAGASGTTMRGVVTTLADGTIVVRYDPRLAAVAARIRRGELRDRAGRVVVGTGDHGERTWPLGAAFGTLAGPVTAEVLRPAWSLERLHDATLRGYPERDDGPAVWTTPGVSWGGPTPAADGGERLLFAVRSRVEQPADRARAEALAGDGVEVRLLPLPSPDWSGLLPLVHGSDEALAAIADDVDARSVTLSIDAELQRRAAVTLAHWGAKAKASAAVVIDVDSGEVLARVQVPDYDPADPAWRAAVRSGDPVFTGAYGPWLDKTGPRGTLQAGSIAKLITALAAARTGALGWEPAPGAASACDGRATPVFDCADRDRQGPSFTADGWTKPIHDHARDPIHGSIDLTDALAVSCNVYFGQLGLALGPAPFADLVADGLAVGWSDAFDAGAPGSRTLASTAFGQGAAAMSPVQAARMVAAIGAGGVYRTCPADLAHGAACAEVRLVDRPGATTPLLAGMSEVMTRGTGRTLPAIPGVRVYGKTGTADAIGLADEVPYGIEAGTHTAPTHAWFVAIAEPAEALACGTATPGRIAVAVAVARGGSGRGTAAPAAIDILRAVHDLGYLGEGPVAAAPVERAAR